MESEAVRARRIKEAAVRATDHALLRSLQTKVEAGQRISQEDEAFIEEIEQSGRGVFILDPEYRKLLARSNWRKMVALLDTLPGAESDAKETDTDLIEKGAVYWHLEDSDKLIAEILRSDEELWTNSPTIYRGLVREVIKRGLLPKTV